MNRSLGLCLTVLLLTAGRWCAASAQEGAPTLVARVQETDECRAWVEQTMKRMTLKEKVGQLFVYTIAPHTDKKNRALLREVVQDCHVGGLLFSGGRLDDQAVLTNQAQEWAQTPLLITFDGEWGLAMRLKEVPAFPRNMALGCIQDNGLLFDYGREVARQCREMGIHVNFAPVADVNINPDNPVINTRSFGEDPQLVADKATAYAQGLESGGVLSVAKHFPGHGDTNVDSHEALPVLPFDRARLDSVELPPFRQAVRSGLGAIMVGHLQVPAIDPTGLPASLSPAIVTGLLRHEMGFKGLIFTDALAMKGVSGRGDLCVAALQAGVDMLLTPRAVKAEIASVLKAIHEGALTQADIDERCRRVLTYKYALGTHHRHPIRLSGLKERIWTPEAADLLERLQSASLTLLGNQKRTLPFPHSADTLLVVRIGKEQADTAFIRQLSQFTPVRTLRLTTSTPTAEKQRWLDLAARKRQVVVSASTRQLKPFGPFLASLTLNAPTVYVLFTPFVTLETTRSSMVSAAAVVAAHSSDAFVQRQVAKALFGHAGLDGRLPAKLPPLFDVGDGVTYAMPQKVHRTPEELGMDGSCLARIDSLAKAGMAAKAFPGCQIYVMRKGEVVYDRCFGSFTYDGHAQAVRPDDLYDLASLTKTTATLLAVMKLYDQGLLNLTDKASAFLPYLRGTDKADITIRQLLLHESGLPPGIPFYQAAIDEESYTAPFVQAKRDAAHPVQAGKRAYAARTFRFRPEWVSTVQTDTFSLPVAEGLWLNPRFRSECERLLAEAPLGRSTYRYGCPNFILLKEVVEHITGEPMDEFLDREFYRPMGLKRLLFRPLRRYGKGSIAPTVRADYLRRGAEMLQGYVHDESAAFFGGVSGNAGLFGTAADVAAVYQLLLDGGTYQGRRYLGESTCHLFTTATSRQSRRGLGFDRPDTRRPEKSPCAASAPASVYGHTGFTGTCAWVDPDNRLVYVFLSNRTFPHPWNNLLGQMNIRTDIQEVLYQALGKALPTPSTRP